MFFTPVGRDRCHSVSRIVSRWVGCSQYTHRLGLQEVQWDVHTEDRRPTSRHPNGWTRDSGPHGRSLWRQGSPTTRNCSVVAVVDFELKIFCIRKRVLRGNFLYVSINLVPLVVREENRTLSNKKSIFLYPVTYTRLNERHNANTRLRSVWRTQGLTQGLRWWRIGTQKSVNEGTESKEWMLYRENYRE